MPLMKHQITLVVILCLSLLSASCGSIPVPKINNQIEEIQVKEQADNKEVRTIPQAETTPDIGSRLNDAENESATEAKKEMGQEQAQAASTVKPVAAIKQSEIKAQDSSAIIVTESNETESTQTQRKEKKIFTRAEKYYATGHFSNAIALLEKLIDKNRNNVKYRDMLVLTYTRYASTLAAKANLLEAQTVLEKALSFQPENRDLKNQLKQLEQRLDADKHYRVGMDALKQNDKDKATMAFRQALDLMPDHKQANNQISLLQSKFASGYHKKAMVLYRKQKLDQAIDTWGKLLILDPEHEMARLYRARALELKEKLDKL